MIELTPDAKVRFEMYLHRIRTALRGTRAIEATEVEQSVREHVELALSAAPAPVGSEALAGVLEQLGPPELWLLDEDRPAWRRFVDRLITGPEDWRLAYVSFGLTLLMVLTFPAGGVLLLVPAFIVSRAWVALMNDRGAPLDARRWLVLPPIVLAMLLFIGGAMGSVIGLAGVTAAENDLRVYGIPRPGDSAEEIVAFAGYLATVAGVWWIVLSALLAFLFEPIRSLFAPVLEGAKRRHLLVLAALGAVCLAIGLRLTAIS
jgi:VIT1/CCC1 family predicted Fe2+/Mn2+ transporter